MQQVLAALPPREWRLSLMGWGTYMGYLTLYCLAHQAYVALVPVDIADSVLWTLREWGLWLILTPAIGAALHHRKRLAPSPLIFYPLLTAAVLTLSLGYRVGLDLAFNEDAGPINSLVYFFPQYALALAIVVAGWHLLQRAQPTSPQPSTPDAQSGLTLTDTLLVTRGSREALIRIDDIQALSAAGNYVEIHTGEGSYLLRSTLKELADRLPPSQFVRTHRSHIVRLTAIDSIENLPAGNGRVYLCSGMDVSLSKGYRQALKQHCSVILQSPHH